MDKADLMHRFRLYAALCAIIICHVLGSLYWISRNVVLVGRDAAGHLERTVEVAAALNSWAPTALLTALTRSDYRPPLLYLLTVPFYRLFGVNFDSAQYTNVALLALLLLLTFWLARRVTSEPLALLAVLLTGLLPMTAAMTRLFYIENLLTTLLLFNLLALLNCAGFTRRRWSLLWGVSLGLALLTKWTAPIYLLLPTLYTLLFKAQGTQIDQAQPENEELAKRISQPPKKLAKVRVGLLALTSALLWLALWWWPNRPLLAEFPLGLWIALPWSGLIALTAYVLCRPATVVNNLASAILLAGALASLWYFPRIDFLNHLSEVAYGTDRGTQESFNLLRLSNYTRYFGFWLSHHMGPLATGLILPPALWGWFAAGGPRRAVRTLSLAKGTPLALLFCWLTLLSGWGVLTFIAQANPRNLNPLLPIIAILLATSLPSYRRWLAWGIGLVWVIVLALQWSLYTFDSLAWLQERAPSLWVQGDYLAWPAHGSSAPGYWIQPDVLATIGSPTGEPASLGMLIDSWEIHRGSLRYLIAANQLNIELTALTESDSRGWSDLLANQWVLLKVGDNSTVKATGQATLARILHGDPLFEQLYRVVKQYPLPSGETAILYHRAEGPARPYEFPVVLIETSQIAEQINRYWGAGATLYLGNADTATWVGIHDLKADRIVMPQAGETVQTVLGPARTGTILAATRYDTSAVQDWLFATSYPAAEFGEGEFRLTIVGRPAQPLQELPIQARWPPVTVSALRTLPTLSPGAVLPIELAVAGQVNGTLKFSLRLVDPQGQVVAQQDKTVEAAVRLGLAVPAAAVAGAYTLGAVLYDPQTLQPQVDNNGQELATLALITVR